MDIKEKILAVVAAVCEVNLEKVSLNTTIGDFPQWDSLGHIKILSEVASEYNIEIEPEDMMEIETVADIVKLVTRKIR